jgi:hypothetical protein
MYNLGHKVSPFNSMFDLAGCELVEEEGCRLDRL